MEDGTRIRLAGEGEAGGQGAPPGDLYVHVGIRPHPFFQREQANVLMRVPLRMTQAALGGDIEVPVIDGSKAKVKIPPGRRRAISSVYEERDFLSFAARHAAICSFRSQSRPRRI